VFVLFLIFFEGGLIGARNKQGNVCNVF